jgi:TetR/AcrR family transcriptional regulator, mexJK operon transcriptional repressor
MSIREIALRRARATTTIVAKDDAGNPASDGLAPASPAPRRSGRPSRTAALELRDRILDVATALFLSQGYGLTTIEAVARRAGISKRTFYHRFGDKTALFRAVVHRVIERMRPPPGVPLLDGAGAHEQLRHLAGLILRAALSPPAIALHRMIIAESARFPELARAVHAEGASREAVTLISELLAREIANGELTADARDFAAQQFLQLVVGVPQRRAIGLNTPLSGAELDAWADDAVRLFLDGCRGWRSREVSHADRARPRKA